MAGPMGKAQNSLTGKIYKARKPWLVNGMTPAHRSLRADLATPGSAVLLAAMPVEAALSPTGPDVCTMARTRLGTPVIKAGLA
eukprot:11336199-Alexandrium_andersonii.AAC.1